MAPSRQQRAARGRPNPQRRGKPGLTNGRGPLDGDRRSATAPEERHPCDGSGGGGRTLSTRRQALATPTDHAGGEAPFAASRMPRHPAQGLSHATAQATTPAVRRPLRRLGCPATRRRVVPRGSPSDQPAVRRPLRRLGCPATRRGVVPRGSPSDHAGGEAPFAASRMPRHPATGCPQRQPERPPRQARPADLRSPTQRRPAKENATDQPHITRRTTPSPSPFALRELEGRISPPP